MQTTQEQQVDHVAREISRYLDEHPNAADSIEGIAEWWLVRQRFEETVGLVQQAVEYLVEQGQVEKVIGHSRKIIYAKAGRRGKGDTDS